MTSTLRVLSYNVKELKLDETAVLQVLRETAADVVALQEVTRHPTGRRRMHRLAARAGMRCVVAGGGPVGSFTTGLFVSPELAPRVRRAVGRPLRWKWWYRRARLVWPTRRGFALVDLGDAVVVSVHLGLDARERAEHCAELLRVLERAGPDRCIVVGDLNEQPGGPSWVALGQHLRDAAEGTTDTTYPVSRPRMRLDVVLVGRDVEPVQVRSVRSDAALRGSDHLPVLAELAVGRNPAR